MRIVIVHFSNSDAPLGQLPYLTIENETKLPQSLAIARYLAREHNLVGGTNLEAAKADAVVDTCIDLMTGFYNRVIRVVDKAAKVFVCVEFGAIERSQKR